MHEGIKTRYSQRPFPAYAFVPGKAPHPTRDPEGHSYNAPEEILHAFDPDKWFDCEAYLYGIDLFNHAYYWEAHEALEAVWITAGRNTQTGLFVQGLIQIAVAQLKRQQGFLDVAQRMANEGLAKMSPVQGVFLGLDTSQFYREVKDWIKNESSSPVIIILDAP